MFNIKLLAEEFFARYVCVGVQRFVSVAFQFHIQFITNNIVSAHVRKTKLVLQFLDQFLM